jgi:hypothetical protein
MLAAAVAAAWSTYLQWLPCQGSMSRDECWRRMDAGISFTGMGFPYLPDLAKAPPWVSELGTAATVLVGVAWLTLVLEMRWQLNQGRRGSSRSGHPWGGLRRNCRRCLNQGRRLPDVVAVVGH